MLTQIINPGGFESRALLYTNAQRASYQINPEQQKSYIEEIQASLRNKGNPLCDLAADLIDFDPGRRPKSAADVDDRLSKIRQEPELARVLQGLSLAPAS